VLSGGLTAATDPNVLATLKRSPASLGALSVSCALGVAMSYFAFLCRSQVSATYFTVIGNVCKVITVFINVLIWDKHASPVGLACLSLVLVAAYFYTPSPLRQPKPLSEEQAALVTNEEEACAADNEGQLDDHENGRVEHCIAPNRVT